MDFLKLHGKVVVWPANLDSTKTRNQGRKLTKGQAVQAPKLEELTEAAKRLSIDVEVAAGKSRPPTWWERGGYLILPKKDAKRNLLGTLAVEIRRIRSSKAAQEKK
jgi:signal recognition particle subunit SRP19